MQLGSGRPVHYMQLFQQQAFQHSKLAGITTIDWIENCSEVATDTNIQRVSNKQL